MAGSGHAEDDSSRIHHDFQDLAVFEAFAPAPGDEERREKRARGLSEVPGPQRSRLASAASADGLGRSRGFSIGSQGAYTGLSSHAAEQHGDVGLASSAHAAPRSSTQTIQAPNGGTRQVRRGRWTKAEHEMFVHGLRTHGQDWKRIRDLIPSRSVVQVRTHAQKYFIRLAKQGSPRPGVGGDVQAETGKFKGRGPSKAAQATDWAMEIETSGREHVASSSSKASRGGRSKASRGSQIAGLPSTHSPSTVAKIGAAGHSAFDTGTSASSHLEDSHADLERELTAALSASADAGAVHQSMAEQMTWMRMQASHSPLPLALARDSDAREHNVSGPIDVAAMAAAAAISAHAQSVTQQRNLTTEQQEKRHRATEKEVLQAAAAVSDATEPHRGQTLGRTYIESPTPQTATSRRNSIDLDSGVPGLPPLEDSSSLIPAPRGLLARLSVAAHPRTGATSTSSSAVTAATAHRTQLRDSSVTSRQNHADVAVAAAPAVLIVLRHTLTPLPHDVAAAAAANPAIVPTASASSSATHDDVLSACTQAVKAGGSYDLGIESGGDGLFCRITKLPELLILAQQAANSAKGLAQAGLLDADDDDDDDDDDGHDGHDGDDEQEDMDANKEEAEQHQHQDRRGADTSVDAKDGASVDKDVSIKIEAAVTGLSSFSTSGKAPRAVVVTGSGDKTKIKQSAAARLVPEGAGPKVGDVLVGVGGQCVAGLSPALVQATIAQALAAASRAASHHRHTASHPIGRSNVPIGPVSPGGLVLHLSTAPPPLPQVLEVTAQCHAASLTLQGGVTSSAPQLRSLLIVQSQWISHWASQAAVRALGPASSSSSSSSAAESDEFDTVRPPLPEPAALYAASVVHSATVAHLQQLQRAAQQQMLGLRAQLASAHARMDSVFTSQGVDATGDDLHSQSMLPASHTAAEAVSSSFVTPFLAPGDHDHHHHHAVVGDGDDDDDGDDGHSHHLGHHESLRHHHLGELQSGGAAALPVLGRPPVGGRSRAESDASGLGDGMQPGGRPRKDSAWSLGAGPVAGDLPDHDS